MIGTEDRESTYSAKEMVLLKILTQHPIKMTIRRTVYPNIMDSLQVQNPIQKMRRIVWREKSVVVSKKNGKRQKSSVKKSRNANSKKNSLLSLMTMMKISLTQSPKKTRQIN